MRNPAHIRRRHNPLRPDVYRRRFGDESVSMTDIPPEYSEMTADGLRRLLKWGHTRVPTVKLLIELAPIGNLRVVDAAQKVLNDGTSDLEPIAVFGLKSVVAPPPANQTQHRIDHVNAAIQEVESLQQMLVDFELLLTLDGSSTPFSERLRRQLLINSARAWCAYVTDREVRDDRAIAVLAATSIAVSDSMLASSGITADAYDRLAEGLQAMEEGVQPREARDVTRVTLQDAQHIRRDAVLQRLFSNVAIVARDTVREI
jgi:hypothetical protein